MAPISQRTLSLHNGVSQRSPDLRLPSQVADQINALSHLTRGVIKRPGSRHIAKLAADETGWDRPFVHVIDRGSGEKYYLCLVNGSIFLFDQNGVGQSISIPDGLDYFTLEDDPLVADFNVENEILQWDGTTYTVQSGTLQEYQFGPNQEFSFIKTASVGTWAGISNGAAWQGGDPSGLGLTPTSGAFWCTKEIDHATATVEMDLAWRLLLPSIFTSNGLGLRKQSATPDATGNCYWLRITHTDADKDEGGYVEIGFGTDIGVGTNLVSAVFVPGLTLLPDGGLFQSERPHWGTGQSGDPAVIPTGGIQWSKIKFTAVNVGSTVHLTAYVNGEVVLEATHSGPTAILDPGWAGFAIGGYGDNDTVSGGGTFVDNWKLRTGTFSSSDLPLNEKGYKALTIGDATVIVNTTKIVDVDPAETEARTPEAFIYIRSADYSTNYNVAISGETLSGGAFAGNVSYLTPNLTSPESRADIATDEIAAGLLANLNASAFVEEGKDFVFTRIGSLIRVTRSTGLDFDIAPFDGISDDALLIIKGQVQRFEDLPLRCIEGVVVEVVGDPAEDADNYWVRYEESDSLGNPGIWRECPKPGEPYQWDLSTMPIILTRFLSGTWELRRGDWTARNCGSLETVPFPKIFGRKITDLFYYQGRLGFLAGENVVMSETSDFLNFFQKTSKAIFDSDPIDVKASFGKAIKWHSHALWGERLVLFSDTTQVQLIGDPLTPRTVGFDIIGEYMNSPAAEPRVVGDRIFFPQQMSGHARVAEMFIQQFSRQPIAAETTRDVPSFIDGVPQVLAGTDQPNFLAVLASDNKDTVAVYLWKWNYDRQEQSSWSKWEFPEGSTVGWVTCHDGLLVLFVSRSDGAYLEKIDLTEADVVSDTEPLFLDRRIAGADCSPSFGAGETSWTIPFTQAGAIVIRNSTGAVIPTAQVGSVLTTTGSAGDLTAVDVTIGVPFEYEVELSRFYLRTRRGNEFDVADVTADVRVQYLTLFLSEGAASMSAVVSYSDGRASYTYTQPEGATEWRIPIMASNKKVTVTISHSGHLSGGITGLEWEGALAMRSRRF